MSEKRKHPRIKCQFFTELREDESNNSIGVGEIFDLSSGGAGFESHIPFVTGQKAYIRFLLDGESINLFIEIIHIEEKMRRKFYGVKFIDAPQETINAINKFVEKHSDKNPE